MYRNMARWQEQVLVDAAATAATAAAAAALWLWQHGVHTEFFPHHRARILPPSTPNAAAGSVPHSAAAALEGCQFSCLSP